MEKISSDASPSIVVPHVLRKSTLPIANLNIPKVQPMNPKKAVSVRLFYYCSRYANRSNLTVELKPRQGVPTKDISKIDYAENNSFVDYRAFLLEDR